MGMHDKFLKLCEGLEASVAPGFVVTDSYDLRTLERHVGHGAEIVVRMQVTTAYEGGDPSSLVTPILVASPNPGLAGGGERFLFAAGGASGLADFLNGKVGFVLGDLTQGAEFIYTVPPHVIFEPDSLAHPATRMVVTERQYIGIAFVTTGLSFTAGTGKWTCHIGTYKGPSIPRRHAIGYTGP